MDYHDDDYHDRYPAGLEEINGFEHRYYYSPECLHISTNVDDELNHYVIIDTSERLIYLNMTAVGNLYIRKQDQLSEIIARKASVFAMYKVRTRSLRLLEIQSVTTIDISNCELTSLDIRQCTLLEQLNINTVPL